MLCILFSFFEFPGEMMILMKKYWTIHRRSVAVETQAAAQTVRRPTRYPETSYLFGTSTEACIPLHIPPNSSHWERGRVAQWIEAQPVPGIGR